MILIMFQGVHQFFDYVTNTRIDLDSLFPKKLWNYYCFQGLPTNNGLEGWHYRLNSTIDGANPILYLVLEELRNDYGKKPFCQFRFLLMTFCQFEKLAVCHGHFCQLAESYHNWQSVRRHSANW